MSKSHMNHSAENLAGVKRSVSRRRFLRASSLPLAMPLISAPFIASAAESAAPIHVASMFDLTGNLNIYGIQEMNASKYAIKSINEKGGVLGRQLQLHPYDTQSKIELYSRYSQEIANNKDISAVVACFTGASREASRPILSRGKKLLFFPTIDEGGECDKYTFMQGTDCLQQESPLIEWAIKKGKSEFYVVAADYIYGHVATAWTKSLVAKAGGSIKGIEFIPLDVNDFGSTIRKIQSAKPTVIMSNLVGNNHIAFYRQFAAAGLNKTMQIVSPLFGLGNEQEVLTPAEGQGIVVAYSYFDSINTPINHQFLQGFKQLYPDAGPVADTPVQVWNGWHQWKLAVEKAGTTNISDVVTALELGKALAYDGPSGPIWTDPQSHRNVQNVLLAQVNDKHGFDIIETFEHVEPSREIVGAGTCDLVGKDKNAHKMINPKF